jgi:hypothetical protein
VRRLGAVTLLIWCAVRGEFGPALMLRAFGPRATPTASGLAGAAFAALVTQRNRGLCEGAQSPARAAGRGPFAGINASGAVCVGLHWRGAPRAARCPGRLGAEAGCTAGQAAPAGNVRLADCGWPDRSAVILSEDANEVLSRAWNDLELLPHVLDRRVRGVGMLRYAGAPPWATGLGRRGRTDERGEERFATL